MSDDFYRQMKKKAPLQEELDQVEADFSEENIDPLEKVKQMQEAVARETGQERNILPSNPDSPFHIEGKMPPAFQRALQGSQNLPDMPPMTTPSVQPKYRTTQQPTVIPMSGPSDELKALLEQIAAKHYTWESIELPSKGKFYDAIPGVLNVKPMTGEEEQILATPRHVKKGKAIDMIFERCIKEPIDVTKLLSADRVYMLIYLRGISYTPEYDVEIKCPFCTANFPTTIDLNALELNSCPEDFDKENLTGVLPTTGLSFSYRLASGKDEQEISRHREMMVSEFGDQSNDDTSLFRTALLLEHVDKFTDRRDLELILKKLPISDVSHLRNTITNPPFGVNTEVGIVCPSCSEEFEIDLPLEASFFFPGKKEMRSPHQSSGTP